MELGIANVVGSLLHGDTFGVMNGQPLEKASEFDVDLSLFVIVGNSHTVRAVVIRKQAYYSQELREDRGLLHG